MDESIGKNGSGDSRSTIAHRCQSGENLLDAIKTNFLLHSSNVDSEVDKVLDKQQQPQKSSVSDDQEGTYEPDDETPRRTPIKLNNGHFLEEGVMDEVEESGREKGPIRRLCEESNAPLQDAIRSLEQLNRRIDAFRQSPVWQQSPNIRTECLLLTTPTSSLASASPDDDKLKQVTSSAGGAENGSKHRVDSGIVDDCSSVSTVSVQSCPRAEGGEEKGKKGRKVELTFENGVQMIQDLLLDTQKQCAKMVNENQRTATRFDDELGRCQTQMDVLRKELAYAHRCVNDLEVNMMITGSATESDTELQNAEHEMEAEIYRLREDNGRLRMQFRALQRELLQQRQAAVAASASANVNASNSSIQRHSSETDSFPKPSLSSAQQQIGTIQSNNQLSSTNSLNVRCSSTENNNNHNEAVASSSSNEFDSGASANLQLELIHAREALIALKHDRKRLKAEKMELLNQMKEVYQTLEAKERELRDFIRQFEQKMRESDKGIKELIWEKEKMEKEKKQLTEALENANEKIEQCKSEMEKEKMDNLKLQAQLKELQGRFVLLTGQQPNQPSSDPAKRSTLPTITPGNIGYVSLPVSPLVTEHNPTNPPPQEITQPKMPPITANSIFTPEEAALLRRRPKPSPEISNQDQNKRSSKMVVQEFERPMTTYYEDTGGASGTAQSTQQHLALLRRGRPSGRKNQDSNQERSSSTTANRLSRLFHFSGSGRSKSKDEPQHKNSDAELVDRSSSSFAVDAIAADLNLVEKADHLLQARQIPMARWRQSHVVAWLELELGMYGYTTKFIDNVKSGKVLLSLTDHEIENVLGIAVALHKKKFRLAIEEYRAPALCKFPAIKEVTNQYVCRQWLPSLGMPQYVPSFRQQLIDGRLLNYLNKKQLDKYLGVSRRFHQLSILKGIELLRLFNFDIKALSKRRLECERENVDLLVWTNARLGKWCEQVDLGEYADNLRESCMHGGLFVLDPSFTVDTLAAALGIPSGRQMVRKHLAAEFLPLLNQARANLENYQSQSKSGHRSGGSLGRAFSRSYTISGEQEFSTSTPPADPKSQRSSCKRRRGLRGSIGRVFGLRVRRSTNSATEDQLFSDEISPARSSTMANMGLQNHSGALIDSRTTATSSSNDLNPLQNSSTPANASSPKPLNRSTGTLSSTTSDLGSSIERSQHMKTILGTPKVLTQPTLTSMHSSSKTNVATTTNGGMLKSSVSDAADLSRLQHLCLSPGEVLLNGGAGANSRNPLIRLRNKTRYGVGDVPKMGLGATGIDVSSTRSPGSAPARPHSVGDFGGLAAYYCSPNNNNYQQYPNGQQCQNFDKKPTIVPWWKPNGAQYRNSELIPDNFVSFSPQRLQTWLSAEHFSISSNSNGFSKENGENHPKPNVIQNGQDHVTSGQNEVYTNGHGQGQQQYSMGTIAEQGEPAESENETVSREYGSRPNRRYEKHHHDRMPISPPDQSHYYRQNCKNKPEDSPSRSSSSSLSPSRRDRPKSLPLRASSTNTDLNNAGNRQNRHRDSVTSSVTSSKCEECAADFGRRDVRRQQSVPPLASVDSIHETDL